MRSRNSACGIVVAIGAALGAGNLWFTAARTTIPLSIDAVVIDHEVRREKHAGIDDVHLLKLEDGRTLVVDAAVAQADHEGQRLSKAAWSRQMKVNDQTTTLEWSTDARGMLILMPISVLLIGLLLWGIPQREVS